MARTREKLTTFGDHAAEQTRLRLLSAAGEVFAAKGFQDATVREICLRAGANIAAVNYHFGGKDGLYEAVFAAAAAEARAIAGASSIFQASGDAEAKLGIFVRVMLAKVMGDGRENLHSKLMLREMVDPTPVLVKVVENDIRPFMGQLRLIVTELLGAGATEANVRRSCNSVVGQCLFYKHCRPVLDVLYPHTKEIADELAAHITRLSIAGIRSIGRPEGERAAKHRAIKANGAARRRHRESGPPVRRVSARQKPEERLWT